MHFKEGKLLTVYKRVNSGKDFDAEIELRKHFIYLLIKVVVKRPSFRTYNKTMVDGRFIT